MQLSILIPTKDRFFLIKNCLESLKKTLGFTDAEILLGDTGSTEPEVFKLYEAFGATYPRRFEVFSLQKYHFSSNNNFLASKAKGKFLLLLNNDTVLLPDWWKPLENYLERPNVGAVGSKLLFAHNDRVQHAGIELVSSGVHRFLGYHPYRGRRADMPEVCIDKYVPAVTGAALGIRRETYARLGGLDEAYQEECQDVDFCLKLLKQNLKSVYASGSVFYHLENGTRTVPECPEDRKHFVKTWKHFIQDQIFKERFQSSLVDLELREKRKQMKRILMVREQARGDVLASSSIVEAFKEENPDTHITFKTRHPDLIDSVSSIDRVLHVDDIDSFTYDREIKLTYEDGKWAGFSHTWLEEMARPVLSAPLKREAARPKFSFSAFDKPLRQFYSAFSTEKPYVLVATGAGWPEREWTADGWEKLSKHISMAGFRLVQIGGGNDYAISSAFHLFDRSLHENLAVAESAKMMVTVDSFPYHVGAAVGLSTVLLTCKSCAHTVATFPGVQELRNRWSLVTPAPGCREFGCRQKYGEGQENHCATPILKHLTAEKVFEVVKPLLEMRS